LVVAKDECYTNADCYNDFLQLRIVCCKNARDVDRYCQPYNCEGRYCLTHGDCGGEGACCMKNKCTNSQNCPRCNSSSDCAVSEYCCVRAQGNVCRRSCVGERCDENSDCTGPKEYCDSDNVCAKSTSSTTTTKKTPEQKPTQTPEQISKQTPDQIPDQNAPTQKMNSCTSTAPFPPYAIVFIILLAIIVLILGYLLYDRCKTKSRRETQNDVERNRQTRSLPPVPRTQSLGRAPPPTPSNDCHATNGQNISQTRPRTPPPTPDYGGHATNDQNIEQTGSRAQPPPSSSQTHPYAYADCRFINMPPGV
ncbi:Hypothetical predicted protein, partial [Paramuricea clavata]